MVCGDNCVACDASNSLICSDAENKDGANTTVAGGDVVTSDGVVSCFDVNAFDEGSCKVCSELHGEGCTTGDSSTYTGRSGGFGVDGK